MSPPPPALNPAEGSVATFPLFTCCFCCCIRKRKNTSSVFVTSAGCQTGWKMLYLWCFSTLIAAGFCPWHWCFAFALDLESQVSVTSKAWHLYMQYVIHHSPKQLWAHHTIMNIYEQVNFTSCAHTPGATYCLCSETSNDSLTLNENVKNRGYAIFVAISQCLFSILIFYFPLNKVHKQLENKDACYAPSFDCCDHPLTQF